MNGTSKSSTVLSIQSSNELQQKTSTTKTNTMEDTQVELEKRLKEALETRESTEATVKYTQKELELLFHKKGPRRPRETIEEIEAKISKLELERTINSMPLNEEKMILKQIHKLTLLRKQIEDFQEFDSKIKEKKSTVGQLRESLKEQRAGITELQTELATVNTAVELGCNVKDLVGKKVECPPEKIGKIIGKKGKNVQNLMSTAKVNVDIVRKQGDIRLIGTIDSLDTAVTSIDKVIQQTEEIVEFPKLLHKYITSAKINTLPELRTRYAEQHNLYFGSVQRDVLTVQVRGTSNDIQLFREEIENMEIISVELDITSRDAGLLVGKAGTNIAKLVEKYQVAIEVQKHKNNNNVNESGSSSDSDDGATTQTAKAVLIGPIDNVTNVRTEIEEMIEESKDKEESIPIDAAVKNAMLLNNGTGIQTLHKKVNEATKRTVSNDENSAISYVSVNLQQDHGITMKGKRRFLTIARPIVKDEINRLESILTKIKVDPVTIPVFIGKGGQGIQQLKEGTTTVYVDVDRNKGEITICGMEKDEVDKVVKAVENVKKENEVKRIRLQCDDDSDGVNGFSAQIRNFLRSSTCKEIRDMCFFIIDDDMKQIVLRGKPDSIIKASNRMEEYIVKNYLQELIVTTEDITALLTGGKNSKIVEIATHHTVTLNTDRDRQAVIARGDKEKVKEALQAVRLFLYGGDDVNVLKITLEGNDLMGIVIGRGGKTKIDLEKKYNGISIIMDRNQPNLTLRGPKDAVNDCYIEIMKLIHTASITRTIDLTEKDLTNINKTKINRRIQQTVPVGVTISDEKKTITFRGITDDVHEAIALLNEQLKGIYESRLRIGSILFKRMKDTCRNPTHLNRIKKDSNASITLDEKKEEIVVSGKRPNVKKAKQSLISFFEFLMGANMGRCDADVLVLSTVAKPASLAEVSAKTGTKVFFDRDIGSIFLFSSDEEKVDEAKAILQSKIDEASKLIHVIQLDKSEDWLVSNIIGKGGTHIKKLRQDTGCKLDVDSNSRRIVASADDAETMNKGKEILETLIDKYRKGYAFVVVPQQDLPAFVGRAGSHITEFGKKYGVDIQIMKSASAGNNIRVTGEEDKVAAAKVAIEEWVKTRNEPPKVEPEAAESRKFIRADQVPKVIGTKGAVINALTKEFGCRIDIDRSTSTIIIRSESAEKRAQVMDKIDQIISGEIEVDEDSKENDGGTKTKQKPDRERSSPGKKKQQSKQKQTNNINNTPIQPTDFPSLTNSENKTSSTNIPNNNGGSRWASIVTNGDNKPNASVDDVLEEMD